MKKLEVGLTLAMALQTVSAGLLFFRGHMADPWCALVLFTLGMSFGLALKMVLVMMERW